MEEKKSKNGLLVVLLVILVVACVGCGIYIGKNMHGNNAKKDADTKQEEKKDETKKEEEIKDKDDIYAIKTDGHKGCGVCDENGNLCCPIGDDITSFDFLHVEGMGTDVTSEVKELKSGDYKYQVRYITKNGETKVEVNGRSMYNDHYDLDYIFVLDNGILGVEYYDGINQANLKTRIYYTTDLQSIRKVEGVKDNVSLFAKEYEVIERGNVCIDNKYVELRTNKVTIGSNSVRVENIKTDKEENCAGLT